MDDIQLAIGASPEIGRLYKEAKAFSVETPVLALSFLRGLAAAFCDCLDREMGRHSLSEKIEDLNRRGMLKQSVFRQLKRLQSNGNKAAHPENYDFVDLDFPALAAEAMLAARGLIENLYYLRHEEIPQYEIAKVESSALKDMCARAMLYRDAEAMNQAGEYFKERAEQLSKNDPILAANGYGLTAKHDIDQSMFWFKQGAAIGHPNCMYQYGYYLSQQLHTGHDAIQEGERYIAWAAEADHADAILYVAQSSLEGSGIFAKDHLFARELLERAVKLGQPMAMAQLGAMYATGTGVSVDPIASALLTLQAARAGDPQGQFNLSVLYMEGNGLPQDNAEAIKWLIEAAEQDYPEAVYNLATFIRAGLVHGRLPAEAELEFERSLKYEKYYARAALSLAEMINERSNELPELVQAAAYVQHCYETISHDGDPDDLMKDCLAVSVNVVGRLRKHLNEKGSDETLNGGDIMTSALFNKECIPCVRRQARLEEVAQTVYALGRESPEAGSDYLLREACLHPRTSPLHKYPEAWRPLPNPTRPTKSKKLGRNDLCHCGSKLKYKRCHGRG